MKRKLTFFISFVMIFTFAINAFGADFNDFGQDHWAYGYVTKLVENGTINGFEDGSFRPEGTVTRALMPFSFLTNSKACLNGFLLVFTSLISLFMSLILFSLKISSSYCVSAQGSFLRGR